MDILQFGASFSVPYAQYLGLEPKDCMTQAITDLGIKRFRLMSYWNHHEPQKGIYDFTELDWQIDLAERYGVEVTLCLGLKQPRWPESHWPKWVDLTKKDEWQQHLFEFITEVVTRYKNRKCIVSYQLENEALLRNFGDTGNFDRNRLRDELKLVKSLDPTRSVLMSTSDSFGIPVLGPKPDMYGFSIYRYFHRYGRNKRAARPAIFYRLRALIIYVLTFRKVFIHELQAEPWGKRPIPEMSLNEQYETINLPRIKEGIAYARRTHLNPIDIWGLEWWYWLKIKHNEPEIWNYMQTVYKRD